MYFENAYVIPSYDDILINSRLLTLKEVLEEFNQEEIVNIKDIKLFFDKDIVSNNGDDKKTSIVVNKGDYVIIVINITNDLFKENIKEELLKLYPNLEKSVELVD